MSYSIIVAPLRKPYYQRPTQSIRRGKRLRAAGFEHITFERYDCDICIGRDMADAIEFAMALGPAGEIIRLAGEEGIKRKPQVVAALKEALEPYSRADGCGRRRAPGSSAPSIRAEAGDRSLAMQP